MRLVPPFPRPLPVGGMVHLRPLPGAPRHTSMSEVLERAREDARALTEGGIDGILVENYGDVPFFPERVPPETVAALTLAVREVQGAVSEVLGATGAGPLIGVNVLRNDARAALGIVAATGAAFLRVNVHTGTMFTDQGALTGRAAETLRAREPLPGHPRILADVFVKHATPPAGAEVGIAARDLVHRGLADGVVVSGSGTGRPTEVGTLELVRAACPDTPIWVGSGVTATSLPELARVADGFIVGTATKEDGRVEAPVDPLRVRELVEILDGIRGAANDGLRDAADPG